MSQILKLYEFLYLDGAGFQQMINLFTLLTGLLIFNIFSNSSNVPVQYQSKCIIHSQKVVCLLKQYGTSLGLSSMKNNYTCFFKFFMFDSLLHARWKGTGEPLPNYSLKIIIFSLDKIKFSLVLEYVHMNTFQEIMSLELNTQTLRLWRFLNTVIYIIGQIIWSE